VRLLTLLPMLRAALMSTILTVVGLTALSEIGVNIAPLLAGAGVAGIAIGSIADYAALVSLSVIEDPNHCDPLPSILDIQSAACASRDKPVAITAGDLAFLKALYYMNTGLGGTLSRDDIQLNMMKQFRGG